MTAAVAGAWVAAAEGTRIGGDLGGEMRAVAE